MLQEEEFNLVEILKDAPKGTKLYSTLFGNCELEEIVEQEPNEYFIKLVNDNGRRFVFNHLGQYNFKESECLLFPSKEQRDWYEYVSKKEMDDECIELVDKLNSIRGVHTTSSCCGHLKAPYMIWFRCNDFSSLGLLYRCVNRNYSDGKWRIECSGSDCNPTHGFLLRSQEIFTNEQEMNESIQCLIENIDYWKAPHYYQYFKNDENYNENNKI
jgi:hypothetical protein